MNALLELLRSALLRVHEGALSRCRRGLTDGRAEPVAECQDGRLVAEYRLDAEDHGVVLRHCDGPGQCHHLGASRK